MNITSTTIDELAPNAAAAKNGRDLFTKKKFANLHISSNSDLIWGECSGSGSKPYASSADFMDANQPVFRCSCPSRQFPCKHGLGLLYAYVQSQNSFTVADIPEDIQSKRSKIEKKAEKKLEEKQEKSDTPKKVNVAALVKKIDAQLQGIEVADKLLKNIVFSGLSSIDARSKKIITDQIKELGNYYINGIQTAFSNLILEIENVEQENYTHAIDQINYIAALLKKSTDYLNKKKDEPTAAPEMETAIEEQIGFVWKLADLQALGQYEEQVQLLQLSFNSYDNQARKEFVDEGQWMNLKDGKIYKTKNFRPYKAVKYIKADNSYFQILNIPEMYIYPGDMNPRIRWEGIAEHRDELNPTYLASVLSYASDNYVDTLKMVKNYIKNPLNDKNPVALLKVVKSFVNGDKIVIEDSLGNKLTMDDIQEQQMPTANQLSNFLPAQPQGMALLLMFNNDIATGLFYAQPLSLITPDKIVRLMY